MNNRRIIDEIVRSCARELFAQYDIPLEPVDEPLDPHEYVTVIGFYGERIRGLVGLGLDREIIARMFDVAAEDIRFAGDCIGEGANQMLGRMKNKLIAYGVTLGSALPMVLRGIEVHMLNSTTGVWPYRFMSPHGGLTIWIDAHIDPYLVLTLREDEELLASREGVLTMF